jgi:glucans biosynthesis protein
VIAALPIAALALSRPAIAASAPGFGEAEIGAQARDLSRRPYEAPPQALPASLSGVDYDGYRDVNFDPDHALWKSDGLPFQLQFFHRGGLHRDRVEIYEVRDGVPAPVAYSPDQFRANSGAPTGLSPDLGFAGFRIHAPINRPSYYDEVAVFLGASYFRAVAKDMLYGLSARGLALGAGGPDEEFPAFRAFWIVRPDPGAQSLEVLALMDSPSCTGAFRFVVTPGETTVFDTTCRLFPRRSRADLGVAPLTSMFMFGPEGGRWLDQARLQIHDSDGLSVVGPDGGRSWRPLANPAGVRSSVLADRPPLGFGLVQRERRFEAYGDALAGYERRPNLWVEPVGDWGPGELRLVELPTHTEYQDNIVAVWAPAGGLRAGVEARFAYRLHWGPEPAPGGLARPAPRRPGGSPSTSNCPPASTPRP